MELTVVDWASDAPVGRYVAYRCDECGYEEETYEYLDEVDTVSPD